jgi:molybdopterin-guanine dinucleotide biosynthesis protein A
MGTDKALLDWHGRTLLNHMTDLLRGVTDEVMVVGRDPLPDRLPGHGPLSGIATALETTSTDANLILAVDIPHLTQDFLKYLRVRIENSSHPLVACKIESAFPLCLGIWRPMLPEVLRRLAANDLSVRGLIESGRTELVSDTELVKEGFDLRMFKNINSPEDYRRSR